jgi:hypothetical protein
MDIGLIIGKQTFCSRLATTCMTLVDVYLIIGIPYLYDKVPG